MAKQATPFPAPSSNTLSRIAERVPPHAWFGVSAVFHYLGPAFAVLLFPAIGVLGVAWFRIASAALVLAPITRPWRTLRNASSRERWLLVALGAALAVMNSTFYLALDRLPIALVAAIEFVGTIGIALWGLRTGRNLFALVIALAGVTLLIDVPSLLSAGGPALTSDLLGLLWAVLNGGFFVLYIILGHRISEGGASGGVERLGAAMMIAFIFVMPIGFLQALDAFGAPLLILAGIGVGICSSVIPYICDQLAMSRLPRASFAFLLALLPATATIIGVVVLRQIPNALDVLGVLLVMTGVAIHKPSRL
ncbi:MAG: EamA family transporter [Pseudomonadota bacterium]